MRHFSTILFLTAFLLPFSASAITAAELEAQVQALLNQVQTLQGQISTQPQTGVPTAGGAGAGAGYCPQIGRTLRFGSSGDDVSRLQQYLALDGVIYPGGKTTGYFGSLTQAAVQRWQAKFHIVSSGAPATTGYGIVGPRTAAAIAIVCGGGSYNGVTQSTQTQPAGPVNSPQVGGFLQVSPIQGSAPLQVSVSATINTSASCDGVVYVLDFGDGSTPQLLPSSAGVCQQQQFNIPHTYRNGGTFTITLSANGHSSTALVAVNGPANNSQTTQTTTQTSQSTLVSITDDLFTPKTITIAPGTTVTWTNNGSMSHTVSADNSSWGSGTLAPGASFSQAFTAIGNYPYYCKFHGGPGGSGMSGTVVVASSTSASPTTNSNNTNNTTTTNTTSSGPSFGPLTVTTGANGDLHNVQVQFDLPSCVSYMLDWGDDSSLVQQSASSACTSPATVTHTYSTSGSFKIVLTRNGTHFDQATVIISG